MPTNKRSFPVAMMFLLGVSLPGAIGLSTTESPKLDSGVLSGSYQRIYESEFTQNMPLRNWAGATYRALTLALFNEAGPEIVIGDSDWLFTIEEFGNPAEEVAFASLVTAVRNELDSHGITLIPVVLPDKTRIYADRLPRARSVAIETRYADILNTLRALGFQAADLSDALAIEQAGGDTFMRTDTHWSPLGARLAAEAIADEAGIIGTGSVQFETTYDTETAFNGDLLPFVETGLWNDWVGVDRETLSRPVTVTNSSASDLFGDQEIGIALVGTSFSARSEFNFAGYLQEAIGLDLVNLAVEGRGPFAPMQEALENGAITQIAPRFVIWEIPERYIHTRNLP